MIRINLLPFRLARKKENVRRQVSIFLLSIVFILVAFYYGTLMVNSEIDRTKAKIAAVDTETKKYRAKANRVAEIQKNLKQLQDKLKVVSTLKTKRDEQQVLLEEMADRIVQTRMWLDSLSADSQTVTVTGIAFDNPTIADFMRNLEKSELFGSVDLRRSRLKAFQGGNQLKAFELLCRKKQQAAKKG